MQALPVGDDDQFETESDSWRTGQTVSVDLAALVEAIYVAPTSPEWLPDLVERLERRLGFDFEVRQSDMRRDPVY
jgi:hypothetical protein